MRDDKAFGERLREARQALGYTQSGIAEAIGSKMRSWQGYEKLGEKGGRMPGAQVIDGLCRLGVNTNWLFTGEGPVLVDDMPPPSPAGPYHAGIRVTPETLANALEALEKVLKEKKIKLKARTRAKLALLTCEYMIIDKAEEVIDVRLRQLVDAVVDE